MATIQKGVDMTDLISAIETGCAELDRSLSAIALKHGHKKASMGMLLHNSGVLLCMLKRNGVDDATIFLVKRQFASLTHALLGAANLDVAEITRIAQGIDEQCALLGADVIEAGKQTDKEGT